MAAKTNTDLIGELREAVAVLRERTNNLEVSLGEIKKLREDDKDERDRLIKLEVKLDHLETKQKDRRAIVIAIVVAIVTTLLSSTITKAFDWFLQGRGTATRAS